MRPRILITMAVAAMVASGFAGRPGFSATMTGVATRISSDPYPDTLLGSFHATEVEPASAVHGSTIVAAFQVGRYQGGGATNIGVARSDDGGVTWTDAMLPRITKAAGGLYDRVSDPAVAYDAVHDRWLVASLVIVGPVESPVVVIVDGVSAGVQSTGVVVSSSSDDGRTWSAPTPVPVTLGLFPDKEWIACDSGPASPFAGSCYMEWDDARDSGHIHMAVSRDGGASWALTMIRSSAQGFAGMPVIAADGLVVVPYSRFLDIFAFHSIDGGQTWSDPIRVASASSVFARGGIRAEPMPSSGVDRDGRVFVAWQSCAPDPACTSNHVVLATSNDGVHWTSPVHVPFGSTTSGDEYIPALAVDPATGGSNTHLAIFAYHVAAGDCDPLTCVLQAQAVSSADSGATWSTTRDIGWPMHPAWLPSTLSGYMLGDYVTVAYVGGLAIPVIPLATDPNGGAYDEATYTIAGGL